MKDIFQNYTADDNLKKSVERGEVILIKKEAEDTKPATGTNVEYTEITPKVVTNSTPNTNNVKNTVADAVLPVEVDNESNTTSAGSVAPSEESENEITKEKLYIEKGNALINTLNLKYINGQLMFFDNYKYCVATEKFINSVIVQRIYPRATKNFCKNVMFYVDNKLYDENSVNIDSNYINFQNGLYDINNDKLIAHTPDVFTVNQVHVHYISKFQKGNIVVDKYLDDITNHKPKRRKALLQQIGYVLTTRTDLQQFFIWFGPTASNGKSTLAKILSKIIGEENVSHKDIKTLNKQFGVSGIEMKQLNIVAELPIGKIKDTAILKNLVTGDTFETRAIYQSGSNVTSYAKNIFTANTLPQVMDTTDGYYRRLNILLFDNKFDVATSNFDFDKFTTQGNLDYLANLALKEYREMDNSERKEFANIEESQKILNEYRANNDTVIAFINDEDYTDMIYNSDIPTKSMYLNYKNFCTGNKMIALGKKVFYKELQEKGGFTKKVINGVYFFFKENPVTNNENK